jgi:hypothetical protein
MTDAIPMTVLKVSHHDPRHMAERYPYAAYGSNLLMRQISERCPNVELMTGGRLLDHRLDFSRVATITLDKTSTVPVGLYKLSANDIERLDKREGMGRVYDRFLVTPICDDGRAVRCFTYIKKETTLEPPTPEYFAKLLGGYRDWHFDDRRLRHARERAQEAWTAGAAERERSMTTRVIDAVEGVRRRYLAKSASVAWAQGEMFEPVDVNQSACFPAREVDWGRRDGVEYFRKRGTRVWYRYIKDADEEREGYVSGILADNLPGAQAYRPVDKKRGK